MRTVNVNYDDLITLSIMYIRLYGLSVKSLGRLIKATVALDLRLKQTMAKYIYVILVL